jgi:hypothetical protein
LFDILVLKLLVEVTIPHLVDTLYIDSPAMEHLQQILVQHCTALIKEKNGN